MCLYLYFSDARTRCHIFPLVETELEHESPGKDTGAFRKLIKRLLVLKDQQLLLLEATLLRTMPRLYNITQARAIQAPKEPWHRASSLCCALIKPFLNRTH